MLLRALIVWCGLLVVAIVNGTIRVAVIVPVVGDTAGHVISTIVLSIAILLIAWFAIPWLGPASGTDLWRIGTMWLALTVAFEFGAGHFLFGNPWSRLLEDYNVLRGRIWVVVLFATATAPMVAAWGRGLVLR
jgi:hypothetical protein